MNEPAVVRMANQIAAHAPDPRQAAESTAAHLRGFWATTMIDDLARIADADPACVTAPVREALAILRRG